MLSPSTCLKELNNLGVKFFTGVPDSLLRDFCECITDSVAKSDQHSFSIPLTVDLNTGDNWGALH